MRPNPSGTTREFTPPTTAASRTPARSWTLWNEHSTAFRSNRNKFSVTCALFSDHMSLYLCPFVYLSHTDSEQLAGVIIGSVQYGGFCAACVAIFIGLIRIRRELR